jgi:ferric-dicitrate binding protein FerR (iron transport regulator)
MGGDKDSHNEAVRRWRERNPGYQRAWYAKNKVSVKARVKRWQQTNKKRVSAYSRKHTTGWTEAEYDAAVVSQLGCCAICGVQMSRYNEPCADHCHKTGKKRGLLCNRCNVGIARFEDSSQLLSLAATYLEGP